MNGREIIPIQLNRLYDTIKLQKTINVEFHTKLHYTGTKKMNESVLVKVVKQLHCQNLTNS